MTPDGVLAERAAAPFLAFAGVNRLVVVDVTVRLVEVAVAVVVIAVPDVELGQIVVDVRLRPAVVTHVIVPGIDGILDEIPDGGADTTAAGVIAVAGGVIGHLHPVFHLAVDGIAA